MKGRDASGAVLDEYKALKQYMAAVENLQTVHAQNASVWKALREAVEKADPGLQQLRELLLSQTSTALWYGIELEPIPSFEGTKKAIDQAIKNCDRIHKNLAEVIP
jgi:hypothetical protein